MTFEECCQECIKDKKLLKEFNRLSGLHLGETRTETTKAIDISCGYEPNAEAMPSFVDFVYNCIWLPLTSESI